jgi:2,3-bisphosphoglycerate-independent phosphoglycerate mutase
MSPRHVLLLFLDGVGLGSADSARNPFCTAQMPTMRSLLGESWFLRERGSISAHHASLAPTDACLGVEGRPQSATGQASLLTGMNVAAEVGQHYGPKPTPRIAALVKRKNLFTYVVGAGGTAAFLNPYPPRFFEAIKNGRRLLSVIPLAAMAAGLRLQTHEDLTAGRAVSPDFTGQGWRDRLGLPETPVIEPRAAGTRLASLARESTFTLLEHWPTDLIGHRQDHRQAAEVLETLDTVLAGLLDAWDWESGLVLITSDHGNLEDLAVRSHTLNPVPTIIVGRHHAELANQVRNLADIAPAVSCFLRGQERRASGPP